MKAKAVSALRSERGLRPVKRNAEAPVVGLAPQTTMNDRRTNTMKTYILRDPKTVEPQKIQFAPPPALAGRGSGGARIIPARRSGGAQTGSGPERRLGGEETEKQEAKEGRRLERSTGGFNTGWKGRSARLPLTQVRRHSPRSGPFHPLDVRRRFHFLPQLDRAAARRISFASCLLMSPSVKSFLTAPATADTYAP